jgi:hypothetical protein
MFQIYPRFFNRWVCRVAWLDDFKRYRWSVTSPVTACLLTAGWCPWPIQPVFKQCSCQPSFQANPCVQATYGRLECDPVLSVIVRMPYSVDSNLGPQVTWLPTLTFMNILLALFHTAVHLLTYGWGNCFPSDFWKSPTCTFAYRFKWEWQMPVHVSFYNCFCRLQMVLCVAPRNWEARWITPDRSKQSVGLLRSLALKQFEFCPRREYAFWPPEGGLKSDRNICRGI